MVKYINILILSSWFVLSNIYGQETNDLTLKDHKGIIQLNVCSRGCYQYYIHTNSDDFYPDSLPVNFRQNNLSIKFTGTLQQDSTLLRKPAPNDKPEPLKKIRNIKISAIIKQENN